MAKKYIILCSVPSNEEGLSAAKALTHHFLLNHKIEFTFRERELSIETNHCVIQYYVKRVFSGFFKTKADFAFGFNNRDTLAITNSSVKYDDLYELIDHLEIENTIE